MMKRKVFSWHVVRTGGCDRVVLIALAVAALVLPAATADAQLNKTLHQDGWIMAAAHAPGQQGSIWRTDLWVHFDSSGGGSAELYFCPQDQDNSSVTAHVVEAEDDQKVVYIEDVVDHYLNVGSNSWVGAIHYVADRNVQVYARVYSISADGSSRFNLQATFGPHATLPTMRTRSPRCISSPPVGRSQRIN